MLAPPLRSIRFELVALRECNECGGRFEVPAAARTPSRNGTYLSSSEVDSRG